MKKNYIWMTPAAKAAMSLAIALAAACWTGCDRVASFDKAQAAADAGNINFFGFYTGMPRADAAALATRLDLDDATCAENPETHEIFSLHFSLKAVRQITKGPSTLNELAQVVANQVGDLEPTGRDAWKYETIDGVVLRIDKSGVEIHDAPRAEEAAAATKRVEQREWERAKAELAATLQTGGEAGETKPITLPGGARMEMVWCPAGTFMMGYEEDQHPVTLTKGFWMAKTEVTQKQWKSVMGNNPSKFKGDNLPVEHISWSDVQEFREKTGLQLPTEAQWEYACRAGSMGEYAGTGNLDDMGWYHDNSDSETHPVGTKEPNAWGLYDMHGNVWEWCQDLYGEYPNHGVTDPKGASSGRYRVERGGSWYYGANDCRSADRGRYGPSSNSYFNLGFRPVLCQD